MNDLELAWQTYEFYTSELGQCEQVHHLTLRNLKKFVKENPNPKRYQRKRVLSKCAESCSRLNVLYKKQVDALSDLIEIHSNLVDIPLERQVGVDYLVTLKNVTKTIMLEIEEYKKFIFSNLE
jgi:hypothetical protein